MTFSPPAIITTTSELAAFCAPLAAEAFITLDTEFIRERTYYSKLCLLQIAGAESSAIIDPLAPGIDLAPLIALLYDAPVLKVFHAARQDLEIFYHMTGKLPSPVYDTQIAAQVCGMGESVSYEQLIMTLLKKPIDKGARFTDWAKRPLTERQLHYALEDVTHLYEAYKILSGRICKQGREHWIAEDMQAMVDPSLYRLEPQDAWKRLKCGTLKPKQLGVLRAISAWREIEARRKDVPRSRIVRDEWLIEIAIGMPASLEAMQQIRGLGNQIPNHTQHALLSAIEGALAEPPESWPQSKKRNATTANPDVVDALSLLLKLCCREADVAPRMLAGRDELEQLASGMQDLPCLQGWRAEVFGEKALRFLKDEVRLGCKNGQLRVE